MEDADDSKKAKASKKRKNEADGDAEKVSVPRGRTSTLPTSFETDFMYSPPRLPRPAPS
jgi:hypothetical protein